MTVPAAAIHQAVASVDPGLPIMSIRTLREQVSSQFTQPRLIARLTSFFGVLSLVLSSIGLYGVTAYNAARRTSEIGIRVALGAHRLHVMQLVLRGAFGLIVVRTCDRAAADVCCRAIAPASVVRHEPGHPAVTMFAAVALAGSTLVASARARPCGRA